jgi:hypothetical protein
MFQDPVRRADWPDESLINTVALIISTEPMTSGVARAVPGGKRCSELRTRNVNEKAVQIRNAHQRLERAVRACMGLDLHLLVFDDSKARAGCGGCVKAAVTVGSHGSWNMHTESET